MNRMIFCGAALAASLLAASARAALPEALTMRDAGSLRWTCGGIGADERRALAQAGTDANLEILFVTAKRGAYLAGAELSVFAKGGATPLLEVASGGPVCLIHAPAGEYRLHATLDGVTRDRVVRLGRPGHTAQRAVLAFPDPPWDGIRASEEEKRQAREP